MSESAINRSLLNESTVSRLPIERAIKESVHEDYPNEAESVMNKAPLIQLLCFEGLAMFIFMFGFSCYTSRSEQDAQAAGAILIASSFAGTLCGANLNPIVTLSNCLKKENRYRYKMLGIYVPAQLVGAIAGLLLSELLTDSILERFVITDAVHGWRVFANQAMGVFVLIFFMLQVSNPNTTFIENEISGFFSIAVFYYIARSYAPAAGLCVNSALSIVLALQYATKGDLQPLAWLGIWLLGDLVGMLAAVCFYDRLYEPIVKDLRQIRRKSENFESFNDFEEIGSSEAESNVNR